MLREYLGTPATGFYLHFLFVVNNDIIRLRLSSVRVDNLTSQQPLNIKTTIPNLSSHFVFQLVYHFNCVKEVYAVLVSTTALNRGTFIPIKPSFFARPP